MTLLRYLRLKDDRGLTFVGALVIWWLFWAAVGVSMYLVAEEARNSDEIEVYK